MTEYTQEEMEEAGLSPEEMAALAEDTEESTDDAVEEDGIEDIPATEEAVDVQNTEDGAGESEATEANVEEEPAEEPTEEGDTGDTEETVAEEEPVAAVEPKQAPIKMPETVPDEFKARFDDLDAKLGEGDIDIAEYNRERDLVNRQLFNYQQDIVQWQTAQQNFWASESNKAIAANPILFNALNEEVKRLANTEDGQQMDGLQLLNTAKESLESAFGIKKEEPAPVVETKEEPAKNAKKPSAKKPTTPNLGDMPAEESEGVSDRGEFAHLDNLNGLEFEAALAALPEAAQERYLKG